MTSSRKATSIHIAARIRVNRQFSWHGATTWKGSTGRALPRWKLFNSTVIPKVALLIRNFKPKTILVFQVALLRGLIPLTLYIFVARSK
jgi:hypothetical protein